MSTGSSNVNVEETSNRHACAACKHQRRKCTPTCVLAPCFPSSRIADFQSILDIFNISKLTKLLGILNERERQQAARSLQWEADAWKQDKVYGPLGLYKKLEQENLELKNMLRQLQQQNQVLSYGMSSGPGLIGQMTTAPNGGDLFMFNQNWRPESEMTSNNIDFGQEVVDYIEAPQHNTDVLNQQGRGLAIAEPSAAASQYHRNIASQSQGRDFHGSIEQTSSSRVLGGEDQRVVVDQRGGYLAPQGNYGDHHQNVSSSQGFNQGRSSGTRYTPYASQESNRVRAPLIRQENYDYYQQLLLQQQLQSRRQHMPYTR